MSLERKRILSTIFSNWYYYIGNCLALMKNSRFEGTIIWLRHREWQTFVTSHWLAALFHPDTHDTVNYVKQLRLIFTPALYVCVCSLYKDPLPFYTNACNTFSALSFCSSIGYSNVVINRLQNWIVQKNLKLPNFLWNIVFLHLLIEKAVFVFRCLFYSLTLESIYSHRFEMRTIH